MAARSHPSGRGTVRAHGSVRHTPRSPPPDGAPRGQELGFGLLTRGGKLAVVGFTAEVVPLRLSNLMALDAEAYGNWGADPALYGEALAMVLAGDVDVAGAVGRHALRDAPDVLARLHRHELDHRPVLVPHG
ncbi:MAG: hypothetical protein HS111_38005 [Kofleriaceae bacterium]|nr:hypothetical protein [Kofleriaceae bacterium]